MRRRIYLDGFKRPNAEYRKWLQIGDHVKISKYYYENFGDGDSDFIESRGSIVSEHYPFKDSEYYDNPYQVFFKVRWYDGSKLGKEALWLPKYLERI